MRFKTWAIAIAGLLAAAPTEAAKPWLEARTEHFRVYMRGADLDIRTFASELERFDKALHKLHKIPTQGSDAANPLTVYVVDDVDDVQKLCSGTKSSKGCANIMGFYVGRASGSIAFTPRYSGDGKFDLNAQTILFHEYSHHFMLANWLGAYPAWFVEGFAEFNAPSRFTKQGKIDIGLVAAHRLPSLILGTQLPIARVLTETSNGMTSEQGESFYAKGWLLTHYLTFENSREGQLHAYLAAINKGVGSLEAARQSFGDLNKLDEELKSYVRRKSVSYSTMPVDELPPDAVTIRRLSPGEQAVMGIRMRSDRGVNTKTAPIVAAEARKVAAALPDDPGAQIVLTEAEFDAGNDDAADAAADRVLAVQPNEIKALTYKAQIAMRRLRVSKSTDTAAWRAARQWIIRANRIEPNAAEPLWLFYGLQLAEGAKPTANAILGLQRAFELVPQDEGLRFMLARQMLLDGKLDEGKLLLEPLAYDPHAAPDNSAAKLVALIEKKDQAGIKAFLTRAPDPAEKSEPEPD